MPVRIVTQSPVRGQVFSAPIDFYIRSIHFTQLFKTRGQSYIDLTLIEDTSQYSIDSGIAHINGEFYTVAKKIPDVNFNTTSASIFGINWSKANAKDIYNNFISSPLNSLPSVGQELLNSKTITEETNIFPVFPVLDSKTVTIESISVGRAVLKQEAHLIYLVSERAYDFDKVEVATVNDITDIVFLYKGVTGEIFRQWENNIGEFSGGALVLSPVVADKSYPENILTGTSVSVFYGSSVPTSLTTKAETFNLDSASGTLTLNQNTKFLTDSVIFGQSTSNSKVDVVDEFQGFASVILDDPDSISVYDFYNTSPINDTDLLSQTGGTGSLYSYLVFGAWNEYPSMWNSRTIKDADTQARTNEILAFQIPSAGIPGKENNIPAVISPDEGQSASINDVPAFLTQDEGQNATTNDKLTFIAPGKGLSATSDDIPVFLAPYESENQVIANLGVVDVYLPAITGEPAESSSKPTFIVSGDGFSATEEEIATFLPTISAPQSAEDNVYHVDTILLDNLEDTADTATLTSSQGVNPYYSTILLSSNIISSTTTVTALRGEASGELFSYSYVAPYIAEASLNVLPSNVSAFTYETEGPVSYKEPVEFAGEISQSSAIIIDTGTPVHAISAFYTKGVEQYNLWTPESASDKTSVKYSYVAPVGVMDTGILGHSWVYDLNPFASSKKYKGRAWATLIDIGISHRTMPKSTINSSYIPSELDIPLPNTIGGIIEADKVYTNFPVSIEDYLGPIIDRGKVQFKEFEEFIEEVVSETLFLFANHYFYFMAGNCFQGQTFMGTFRKPKR